MDPIRAAHPKVSLAGVLNPDENRDSAYFSSTDASSKHTSAASNLTVSVLSPTSSGYQSSPTDKTPSPVATTTIPRPLVSPSQQSHMSVASMVSPTTPGITDPRRYERPTSLESGGPQSAHYDPLGTASRRESVDSRMNQGFSDMRLANSPYASHNQSTASIQNTLTQQRHPRPNLEHTNINRISNGYQPSADREPLSRSVRTAPAITGPATSQIARAAEPTKGQAWAFPEEEMPSRLGPNQSFLDSRRSSITESIASSQFTTESRLPPGQRRLDEDYGRPSMSSDFPPVHHHSLQHKLVDDLMDEEGRGGAQPYSRTPELRKSHKLAERKRRTEMKELFDQLRDQMPQERGSKASKWEILTKAITEHERLSLALHQTQSSNVNLMNELESLRRENHALLHQLKQGGPPPPPLQQAPPGPPPPAVGAYGAHDPYVHRTELPPLRTLNGGAPGAPDSMTGVQYDPPRANGYRQDRY